MSERSIIRPEGDACPACGMASLIAEVVDVGVCNITGPWRCQDCGWQETAEDFGLLDDALSENGRTEHGA